MCERKVDAVAKACGVVPEVGGLYRVEGIDGDNVTIRSLGVGGRDRPKIVCLCGSGRFKNTFEEAERLETLGGKIVLTIGCNAHDVAREKQMEHHKAFLDGLHLRKIDLADEILVLNVCGYIGHSTRAEIEYAKMKGVPIRWWSEKAAREAGDIL